MPVQTKLFTKTQQFYVELNSSLQGAQEKISMLYFSFDHGIWAQRIAETLRERALAGIDVRLMVDQAGLITDKPINIVHNHMLMKDLQKSGVKVTKFQPKGNGLSLANRLHCKITAIDSKKVLLGSSNIGDHYLDWSDTNIRLLGELGDTFHNLFDFVKSFSSKCGPVNFRALDLSNILADDVRVWMTVPRHRTDVRKALLNLINNASSSLHIRTWYFLPDDELLEALCAQAKRGVQVDVLLSDRTRVRPIDSANFIHAHHLANAGGRPFRFTSGYMHSKAAWNDRDEILLGSANMDPHSMYQNFEDVVYLRNSSLAKDLNASFDADLKFAYLQTTDTFSQRPIHKKALSKAFNLASAWL